MPLWDHLWFISESKNKKLDVKLRVPDPVLGSSMFSNTPGITSYFPWQKSGLQGRENPWNTLSCLLISLIYHLSPEASGWCEEKGNDEWRIMVRNDKPDVPWWVFEVTNHEGRCVSECVRLCFLLLHVQMLVVCLVKADWRCSLMKEQTSGTSCFSHPIKHINIHVIQYLTVGQHNKPLFCIDSAGFSHCSGLKWAAEKEQRA